MRKTKVNVEIKLGSLRRGELEKVLKMIKQAENADCNIECINVTVDFT